MVNNWLWIMLTDLTTGRELLHGCCFPRSMDTQLVKASAFRHPPTYKLTLGVLIHGLLDGVVNAQRIDTRRTRLHLHLWVMYAWLKIDK